MKQPSIGRRCHLGLLKLKEGSQCLASKDRLIQLLGVNPAGDFKVEANAYLPFGKS